MIHPEKSQFASKGFTLIELMIAISVVAILVAMAVPAYKDYTIRAKVGECINGAAVTKVSISEYRQTLGAWPTSLVEAGLETAGTSHYCTTLSNYQPASGAFTIDVNEAVIDAALLIDSISPVLTPTTTSSNMINWQCSKGVTTASYLKYLPSTCRGT